MTSDALDALDALAQRARDSLAPIKAKVGDYQSMIARHEYPDDLWPAVARSGLFECVVPADYGGNGFGLSGASVCLEALGHTGLPDFGPVLTAICAQVIAAAGAEPLKREILPAVAKGERRIAFAATERAVGSNMFAVRTASRAEGDGFVVDGEKQYISGADLADDLLLVTRDAAAPRDKPAITLLLVERDTPGVEMSVMPTRGEAFLNQMEIRFSAAEVPAVRCLGGPGGGIEGLLGLVNPERILSAALGVGLVRYCLDTAGHHARERKVFGEQPIGAYQAVQHPLADAAIRLEALRALLDKATAAFDNGAPPSAVGVVANGAKYLASEALDKAVNAAFGALGGRGFFVELGLLTILEFSRLAKSAPISDAQVLNFVAEQALGLPRSY